METQIINCLCLSVIAFFLIKIAYIDYRTQYIYIRDLWILAIVVAFYKIYNENFILSLFAGTSAYIFGYAIYKITYLIYKEEAFGLGDVYLLGILGCYWSWPTMIHFTYFVFLLAGIIGIIFLICTQNRKYRIAFGPILNISVFLYHLLGMPEIYNIIKKICV